MRVSRTGRAVAVASGAAGFTACVAALAFGPTVRAVVAAEAAKRHANVRVGAVRPSWAGVKLDHVQIHLEGVDDLHAEVGEIRVAMGWTLRPVNVELAGADVVLSAPESRLHDEWEGWRQRGAHSSNVEARTSSPTISFRGMSLRWDDGSSIAPRVEAHGLDASSDIDGVHLNAAEVRARAGAWSVSLDTVIAELDPAGKLRRARAAAVVAQWTGRTDESGAPAMGALALAKSASASASPPMLPAVVKAARPEDVASASTPLFSFPDLGALKIRIHALEAFLAERLALGADIGVDALTWKVGRATSDKEPNALTVGPGPLSVARSGSGVEVRFSADPTVATTPLTVRLIVPTDGTDAAVALDGGPVSLFLLGIREGEAGLVDVEHAGVAGRARVVFAADGSAVTFDGDVGTSGLSIQNAKLATDTVRKLDLHLRARGVITSEGQLRIDDWGAAVGALTLNAAGHLEQSADHVVGAFRFESPPASCQSLLDSLPAALLPELAGAKMTGTFDARGQIAFDSRALDRLQLDYDVGDRCRLVDVPPWLAREQFERPFSHRIYMPDGSLAEQTTGPGTSNWTSIEDISPYMQVAVLTTEDGAFPRHHGFNRGAIRASLIANLKARRFVRGASTITMQLAKNLFLSRDKTLSRKLEEVVLTEYLEQTFSKDELMELYLNVIEFGPAVYGITAAADYYFGRTPAELNLAECLFLSSLLPAPRRYGAMRERGDVPDGWMRLLHTLMEIAHRNGRITDAELGEAEGEMVVFWNGNDRPPPRPAVEARPRLDGDTDDVSTVPADDVPEAP